MRNTKVLTIALHMEHCLSINISVIRVKYKLPSVPKLSPQYFSNFIMLLMGMGAGGVLVKLKVSPLSHLNPDLCRQHVTYSVLALLYQKDIFKLLQCSFVQTI